MTFITVFRATVSKEDDATLLEIRGEAIAEAQRLCPELLAAQLVRLDNGEWLDILTWSVPDGLERLGQHEAKFTSLAKMHSLFEVLAPPSNGELVHKTDSTLRS